MIVAAGWLLVSTRSMGSTVSWLGATPKVHIRVAPLQTCCGMVLESITGRCNSKRARGDPCPLLVLFVHSFRLPVQLGFELLVLFAPDSSLSIRAGGLLLTL